MLRLALAAFAVVLATSARASLADDIATCIGLQDDKARLACFDAAANLMVSRLTSDPEGAILKRFKKEPAKKKD